LIDNYSTEGLQKVRGKKKKVKKGEKGWDTIKVIS
jgi:hypothetical protein